MDDFDMHAEAAMFPWLDQPTEPEGDDFDERDPELDEAYQEWLDENGFEDSEENYEEFLAERRSNDPENCWPYNCHDLSDEADALASAGFGTDEDYNGGCYEDYGCLGDEF